MAPVSTLQGEGGLEFLVEITIGSTTQRIAFFGINTPSGHHLAELLSISGMENRIGVIPGSIRPQQVTLKIDDSSRRWSILKASNAFIGAAVEIKWGDPSVGISDFERIAGGRVSGWSRGKVTLDLQVEGDSAAALDSPFPWIADKTTYPNIPGEPEPALVPIAYGDFDSSGGTVPAVLVGNLLPPSTEPVELYVSDRAGDELWRVNPLDPGDESGDFGLVGDFPFPQAVYRPDGIAFNSDGDLYCIEGAGDRLYLINVADPSDTSGDYGLVGDFGSGSNAGAIVVSPGGAVYVIRSSGRLWLVNPLDPSDESGDFGLVGTVSGGSGGASFSPAGDLYTISANNLYRVNVDNPSDTTDGYGLVGTFGAGIPNAQSLAIDPDGKFYVTAFDGTTSILVRINPDDPSDTSGDFGTVGSFPANLQQPSGMTFRGPHHNEWIASIGTATPTSAWYTDRSTGRAC